MTPTSRKAAILTDYILSVGLRLSAQLEELFEIEVRPIIEAATTLQEHFALQDGWQNVRSSRDGTRRFFQKGKITLGKERIVLRLRRQLRSLEYIAIGQPVALEIPGAASLIVPSRWNSLVITWGEDAVKNEEETLRDVHVARLDRLASEQQSELKRLLYELSRQRVDQMNAGEPKTGRPPQKRELVKAWMQSEINAGTMPKTQSAAMSKALKHFALLLDKRQISDETIRRPLAKYYNKKETKPSPPK